MATAMHTLKDQLEDSSVPTFLFGCTPPREGTDSNKAQTSCTKFAARSAVLATDGFIVYDIQDEKGRTEMERPFPFRKTLDPSWYGSLFPTQSGKQTVIYKCVVESSLDNFRAWFEEACNQYKHNSFVLVGAPTSSRTYEGCTMKDAAAVISETEGATFGCVTIAERHTKKNNEHKNMMRKQNYGAEYFITQGIFTSGPIIRLIKDYGELCKELDVPCKKMILTFAPCGREKTLTFIKWLGMHVPEEVQARIFAAKTADLKEGERDLGPVRESCKILTEVFQEVLTGIVGCGVPIGINVESLSIFREEIDAAHSLFQTLQSQLLSSRGSPWAIKWYDVGKGGNAYSDIVIVEKERERKKRDLIVTALLAGVFGVVLGRSNLLKR